MLVFAGISHHSAPLSVREGCAIAVDERARLRAELARQFGPVVLLSTCGRIELYLDTPAERTAEAAAQLSQWLARRLPGGERVTPAYIETAFEIDAARRALRVACGLDSAVLGEDEILGQVRRAWLDAGLSGTLSPALDSLFRSAVRTGREARRIGSGSHWGSLADAAAAEVVPVLQQRESPRLLIAGSGPMGMHAARVLRERFGSGLAMAIAGRTPARVTMHAAQVAARPLCLRDLPDALAWADAAVFGLRTRAPVIGAEALSARSSGRPLLIVDLSLPRAVEAGVGLLDGVRLCNVDQLGSDEGQASRWDAGERLIVEEMVEGAVKNYVSRGAPSESSDTLRALRIQAEGIRQTLLASTLRRLPQLDDEARRGVDSLTRALVNRLLHDPTMRLKTEAGGDLSSHTRALFGLDARTEADGVINGPELLQPEERVG